MFSISEEHGNQVEGEFTTRGKFECFGEHFLGKFESRHEQHGHVLIGFITVHFRGYDELACAGLNDPDLGQALGFRGNVTVRWEDLMLVDEPFDRLVVISYETETLGEESDFAGTRRAALLDLRAISAFLNRAIYTHLHAAPHTAELKAPVVMS